MNIKEVIDCGRYTIFSKMGDENRNKHVMIVNYIDQIASASSIDIGEWNIFELFGAGKGNNLITDRREINRRFFAKFREEKSNKPQEELSIEAAIQERLNNLARGIMERKLSDLAGRKDYEMRAAKRLSTQMTQKISEAFKLDQQIRIMANQQVDIGAQIATIVAEGFWKYEAITEDNVLKMVTTGDVVCNHINKAAGIDVRVNLGKFRAKLYINDMELTAESVVPYEQNIFRQADLPHHPHVNGSICWGRSQNTVIELLAACELVEVFRIFANLLCDYNDENPYAALVSYQRVIEQNAKGEKLRNPDEDDDEDDDDRDYEDNYTDDHGEPNF